ncbi:hypothetical protein DM02DRAFT_156512 [Periconia macrospinosa]|uniref:Uncharacterized protein n=1 Tax=Periconia macrospinosa TaxID=97972 RepID=A0A2V1EEV5_9PLEO|nr:hypothetical protein DM02DRAFT_156512 [Periconia macrospinosa]
MVVQPSIQPPDTLPILLISFFSKTHETFHGKGSPGSRQRQFVPSRSDDAATDSPCKQMPNQATSAYTPPFASWPPPSQCRPQSLGNLINKSPGPRSIGNPLTSTLTLPTDKVNARNAPSSVGPIFSPDPATRTCGAWAVSTRWTYRHLAPS